MLVPTTSVPYLKFNTLRYAMGNTLSRVETINGQQYWQMPSPDGKRHWNVWVPRPQSGESISILSADGKGYHLCTAASNPTNDTIKTETTLLERYLPEEAYMYSATGRYTKNPNWLPSPYTEQEYQKRFCRLDEATGKWVYNESLSRPHQGPLGATNITDDWIYCDSNDTYRSCGLSPF